MHGSSGGGSGAVCVCVGRSVCLYIYLHVSVRTPAYLEERVRKLGMFNSGLFCKTQPYKEKHLRPGTSNADILPQLTLLRKGRFRPSKQH